jgi:cytochrome c oxidase subunit 3
MGSHAHGTEVYDHVDPQFGNATPGKVGMWIFLVTDAMSFSGFLLAYGVVRATMEWPNPVQALGGVGLSGAMTFLLICSSVSMVLAIDACKNRNRQAMLNWLGTTILGGAAFLGLQVYEYMHLSHDLGMKLATYANGNHLFASTFFMITGFHGLHVLTGVIYLICLFVAAYNGKYDHGNHNMLEIGGLFWHFVDLVWILVFTFVYLL